MIDDARAKITLPDGREVWRQIKVYYREVDSGRWISTQLVEGLIRAGETRILAASNDDLEHIRDRIVEVQSQIALDKESGARSTSAARLVLKALHEMQANALDKGQDPPWFVLGRQLAEHILQMVEEVQGVEHETD